MVIGPSPISVTASSSANLPNESLAVQNKFVETIPQSVATAESSKNQGAATGQFLAGSDPSTKTAELRDQIFGAKGRDTDSSSDGSTSGPSTDQKDIQEVAQQASAQNPNQVRQERAQAAEDQAIIQKLVSIDRKVKAHEQAHASVGGAYAGSPSFTFKTGPNGVRYAVAGEVPIDTSAAGTPEATLRKSEQVARAALAPANPSPTDRRIASSAQALASKARFEIAQLAADKIRQSNADTQARINGEEIDNTPSLESGSSFSGGRLLSALATDATEQVGGQISASA